VLLKERLALGVTPSCLVGVRGTKAAFHWARPVAARLPSLEASDYLPAVIAGLPLSDVYRERLRLMTVCAGRYHDCSDVPGFDRRLIYSGIVDAW
jgi:hypothetical protein